MVQETVVLRHGVTSVVGGSGDDVVIGGDVVGGGAVIDGHGEGRYEVVHPGWGAFFPSLGFEIAHITVLVKHRGSIALIDAGGVLEGHGEGRYDVEQPAC